ncbi:hypothetical protein H8F10_00235 [Vibrio fluvialis]|uniref:hypothetical protein n=1 Tax=Vibrio fluvialis TaxID=676 RepID=UPI00192B61CF|nr:hypothetical protein [Vibrio fluvialis]MBL4276336.1 hypothetical protein [Vibrio fluvialis]
MYQTIQARSKFKIDKIGPDGPIGIGSSCDGKVDIALKGGNFFKAPFGGFLDAENVIGLRRVKVMYIRALCVDLLAEDVRYIIPNDHYVVGTYLEGKAYLLLYDGEVKHFLPKSAERDSGNNVVSLL